MNPSVSADVEGIAAILVETLGLEDRRESITAETRLFGSLPELDSMAVLELIVILEGRYGIEVEGDDVSADTFETVGSLTDFVNRRLQDEA